MCKNKQNKSHYLKLSIKENHNTNRWVHAKDIKYKVLDNTIKLRK